MSADYRVLAARQRRLVQSLSDQGALYATPAKFRQCRRSEESSNASLRNYAAAAATHYFTFDASEEGKSVGEGRKPSKHFFSDRDVLRETLGDCRHPRLRRIGGDAFDRDTRGERKRFSGIGMGVDAPDEHGIEFRDAITPIAE